ncbi:transposase, Mutator family protein [Mycobacterium ulcerans str. Harvey]|uniref:Mutator family transposase n=1 Tax=Mycobacterium ulcerans str. Harvey TaxID=1299332 RepID=A0ABN0QKQ8_MYCUL|nr:transposase, Mutator family protein [Mycobacterium ulcerans str. Harvey]
MSAVFPDTVVQTCIIHLIRGTFRYAGRQHHTAIARALKPIYTAVNAAAAAEALDAFDTEWDTATQRQFDCGAPPGMSSSHSWTTTPR